MSDDKAYPICLVCWAAGENGKLPLKCIAGQCNENERAYAIQQLQRKSRMLYAMIQPEPVWETLEFWETDHGWFAEWRGEKFRVEAMPNAVFHHCLDEHLECRLQRLPNDPVVPDNPSSGR